MLLEKHTQHRKILAKIYISMTDTVIFYILYFSMTDTVIFYILIIENILKLLIL